MNDWVVIIPSAVFTIATAFVLFFLARLLFGDRAALMAVLLYSLHAGVLFYATSGLTEPAFAFFLAAAFLLVVKGGRTPVFLGAGLLVGMAALTRDAGQALMPGFLLYVAINQKERRVKTTLLFLLGFALALAPHWARNFTLFGNPFTEIKFMLLAGFSSSFPEYTLEKSLVGTSPWPYILANPLEYVRKFFSGLDYFYWSPSDNEFNPYFLALFLVSLLRPQQDRRAEGAKLLLLGLIALQIIASSISVRFYRYLFPLLPLAFPFVADFILYLIRREGFPSPLYRKIAAGAAALFLIYPFLGSLYQGFQARELPTTGERAAPIVRLLEKHTAPSEVVMSDIPQMVAWYANRTAVHLPYRIDEAIAIDERYVPIKAILLTDGLPERYRYAPWWNEILVKEAPLPGFKLVEKYTSGQRRILLYLRQ